MFNKPLCYLLEMPEEGLDQCELEQKLSVYRLEAISPGFNPLCFSLIIVVSAHGYKEKLLIMIVKMAEKVGLLFIDCLSEC